MKEEKKQTFRVVFYRSENGELIKVREFARTAASVNDLVSDPPQEFLDMLGDFIPIHGWAEINTENTVVYVIFATRFDSNLEDIGKDDFHIWLDEAKPSDLN